MIKLDLEKYVKHGHLILSKRDIQAISEAILKDFKPEALKTPTAISADEFIENYLQFNLRYEDITHNQSVLGMVTFSGGNMAVYDKDNHDIQNINLDKNTILIDNSLLGENCVGRYEFTGFHESGHCILHSPKECKFSQISFLETIENSNIICGINNFAKTIYTKTQNDWKEWQADYFSACMKLPAKQVRAVAIESLRSIGIQKDSVCVYEDSYTECSDYLPCMVADLFSTSKIAAKYRLQELKILKTNQDFFDLLDNN